MQAIAIAGKLRNGSVRTPVYKLTHDHTPEGMESALVESAERVAGEILAGAVKIIWMFWPHPLLLADNELLLAYIKPM